jgi:type VI secretion system protein VasI
MRPVLYAALAVAAALSPISASADSWQTTIETSPIDDSRNVYLSVMSNDPIDGRFGAPAHPILYARCKENRTDVVLEMATFEAKDYTTVTMRLDSEKAQRVTWQRSTDGKALFYKGGSPVAFIGQLAKHKSPSSGLHSIP